MCGGSGDLSDEKGERGSPGIVGEWSGVTIEEEECEES
jgi:hypothetical protein